MSAQSRAMLLYRCILREHRNRLPAAMRKMGNAYVRNEFVLHIKAKPEHVTKFYTAWDEYLEGIRQKGSSFGADLDAQSEKALSDAQREQLVKLKEETRKFTEKGE